MTSRGSGPATRPAVHIDIKAILAKMPEIRSYLRGLGVHRDDLPDVEQEIALGAWRAIKAGRFRPPPELPLDAALLAWLRGIAWRQASHHRERAFRRRELPAGLLGGLQVDEGRPDDQLDAKVSVAALASVPEPLRSAVLMRATGHQLHEIAEAQGVPIATANNRVQGGKKRLQRRLAPAG